MKILVIGGGGREHTLAWKLAQSPKATKLYAIPGNPGMAEIAECVPDISIEDNKAVVDFAKTHGIDLAVVGPEVPLTNGIVDAFEAAGILAFGPRKLAAGGAQSIAMRMQGHADAIEKTGVGLYFGDHSPWKTMDATARKEWIATNAKPGTTPAAPKENSCIGWAMENVGAAYAAAGKSARWREIQATVTANGSKGTDLAKELKKDGWESVYWNPDAKHPDDGNAEHSFSAVQVGRGKGYYGVAVDHTVQNYRPTAGEGTTEDQSGTAKLNKVPFFFGLAKGGMHTFVGREGKVNEFHWAEMPDSQHAIEERPLKDFPWNSGLIMVPPGTWPK